MSSSPYNEVGWVDGPLGGTPLDAAELGIMDQGIADEDARNPSSPASLALAALYGHDVRAWAPNTVYLAGQAVVSPTGDVVTAKTNHTSGATFSGTGVGGNWNLSATFEPAGLSASTQATVARVVTLSTDPAAATANTASIQAALNAGGIVRISAPGAGAALINNTLTVGSHTTVEVACTLQLSIGSAALPIWQNAAHLLTGAAVSSFTQSAWNATSTPPGIQGAITVASHSLVVGDWIAIEGSTTSGYNGVFHVIAVTSTTLTVLMPFTAAATTAAGSMTFVKADTDITIRGGVAFQNGANQTMNAVDNQNCGSIWHRFANLTIERMKVVDSKRYAWHIACGTNPTLRNLRVENVNSSGASDGVHFGGALSNIILDGVTGTAGDDFVSLTIGDYSTIQMSKGDFYNTRISNLAPESTKGEAVKMTGGSGQFFFKDTVIDGVRGVASTFVVQVYDDPSSGGTLTGTAGDRLVVKNVACSAQVVVYCNITGAFDSIEVQGVNANLIQNTKYVVEVDAGTVHKVSVAGVTKTNASNFLPGLIVIGGTSVVDVANVTDCRITSGGVSGQYHYTVFQNGGTLSSASVMNSVFQSGGSSGGAVFSSSTGAVDGVVVSLHNVSVNQLDTLAKFLTTGTLVVGSGVQATNLWSSQRITCAQSGKKLTLMGGPILPIRNKPDLVVSGGGLSDVLGDFYLDGVQVTTPSAGSRFYNTNTSWASGTGTDKSGLYAYTGAAWTKVYGPA